jgi:hypothetical protein
MTRPTLRPAVDALATVEPVCGFTLGDSALYLRGRSSQSSARSPALVTAAERLSVGSATRLPRDGPGGRHTGTRLASSNFAPATENALEITGFSSDRTHDGGGSVNWRARRGSHRCRRLTRIHQARSKGQKQSARQREPRPLFRRTAGSRLEPDQGVGVSADARRGPLGEHSPRAVAPLRQPAVCSSPSIRRKRAAGRERSSCVAMNTVKHNPGARLMRVETDDST